MRFYRGDLVVSRFGGHHVVEFDMEQDEWCAVVRADGKTRQFASRDLRLYDPALHGEWAGTEWRPNAGSWGTGRRVEA